MLSLSFCFIIGALFASCGNCIAYRESEYLDWVHGHSRCDACGHQLSPLELIPVLSCIALRGRCSKCNYYFGYEHAISEATLGLCCVILSLNQKNIPDQLYISFICGFIYCIISYCIGYNIARTYTLLYYRH